MIESDFVLLHSGTSKKIQAKTQVESGQVWRIDFGVPSESDLVPEDLPIEVLFEDEAIIVINKAAGMVVHPGAGHRTGTLANALRFRYPDIVHLVQHCDLDWFIV